MSILFEIRYKIIENKRDEYLELISRFKSHYQKEGISDYKIYQDEKNPCEFTEIFLFEDENAFEKFEEDSNEEINEMLTMLVKDMVLDQKIKYRTKKEIK